MNKSFQIIYILLFTTTTIIVIVSSLIILTKKETVKLLTVDLPKPPQQVSLEPYDTKLDPATQNERISRNKQAIENYVAQVNAYTQQVSTYKTYTENYGFLNSKYSKQAQFVEVYKLVVKDTLLQILNTLILTLAVYAFADKALRLYSEYRNNNR